MLTIMTYILYKATRAIAFDNYLGVVLLGQIDAITERKVDAVTAAFKAKEKEILD